MPLYFFHAEDSAEVDGECHLPDDMSATNFAHEIANQMASNSAGAAIVIVTNDADEPVCEIVISAQTLH